MKRLFISKGEKVIYLGKICIIIRIVSANQVSIEEIDTHIIHTVHVSELSPYTNNKSTINHDLHGLSEQDWQKAKYRYKIIYPLLTERGNLSFIHEVSKNNNISVPTIYRWLKIYDETGLVSSLAGKKKLGGKGKSRLTDLQENIINDKIHSVYLNASKKSIIKTIREINLECNKKNIPAPHSNTIRNRIKNISDETKIRRRLGIQTAKYKYEPLKGSFPGADYPLSIVQIDHTLVDIILVDEQNRKPLKRPWVTLAMDVYSRMVLGFYLSFDPPGALGTGMAIANSILPKDIWLNQMNINTEWNCWGIMDTIHVDNAKEFRGNMLKKACINYGINLKFRPIGAPHYGGHIERLLGTFAKEIHNLPGTTFSNIEDRKNYNSKENAAFTLSEFEKWLTIFITKIYHNRIHSAIKTTPQNKFDEGIIGNQNTIGTGIPPRITNERKVRLDFMPYVERSIQEYGVVIDHIYYYSDVLRNYIHDEQNGVKKKHIFKRDPRDISIIYFFDPKNKEYLNIPYKDTSLSPMSIWEYRNIIRKLKENKIVINEQNIFNAFRELDEIEKRAIRETKSQKKIIKNIQVIDEKSYSEIKNTSIEKNINEKILPFEDIEDETFI